MTHQTHAVSMSWRVARALREPGWSGEVVAAFPRSCYLTDEGGAVYAVVQSPLGNGPLSLVVPPLPADAFQGLAAGTPASEVGQHLLLGDAIEIGLEGAPPWDPRAYPGITADPAALSRAIAAAYRAAADAAPPQSLTRLLPYLQDEDLPKPLEEIEHFPRSHALIGGLVEALGRRNRRSLKVVTSSLAGLGPGLTPAGDDFLSGVLVALALAQEHRPDAELAEIAALIVETAAPRTHEISAAYLRAAHAGEAAERWHPLIAAVAAGRAEAVAAAAQAVTETGETSGADMLAGFVAGLGTVYQVSAAPWPGMMLPAAGMRPAGQSPPPAGGSED